MQTAILIEKGLEPFALRIADLDNYINYAPPQNAQDRRLKSFKKVHEEEGIGIYAFEVDAKEAKAIGVQEADKFLHPEKYKDMRSEAEKLRQENAALRAQLVNRAVN
jgi:hypothetical protein